MHSKQSNPIAITGALGNVGKKVVPYLKEKHALRLLDLRNDTLEGLPVIPANILDLDALIAALQGASAIVHFAIADYTGVKCCGEDDSAADYRSRMLDVNVRGTYNVFEAARKLKIARVVYISSMTASLDDDPETRFPPDHAPRPTNFYGCTKLFGEYIAKNYHKEYGIAAYCLRMGQPFPSALTDQKEWKRTPLSSSVLVTHHDVARAVEAALNAEKVRFGVYNVVSVSNHQRIDYSKGEEIGFVPQDNTDLIPSDPALR